MRHGAPWRGVQPEGAPSLGSGQATRTAGAAFSDSAAVRRVRLPRARAAPQVARRASCSSACCDGMGTRPLSADVRDLVALVRRAGVRAVRLAASSAAGRSALRVRAL